MNKFILILLEGLIPSLTIILTQLFLLMILATIDQFFQDLVTVIKGRVAKRMLTKIGIKILQTFPGIIILGNWLGGLFRIFVSRFRDIIGL